MELDVFAASLLRRSETRSIEYELRSPKDGSQVAVELSRLVPDWPTPILEFYQFCDGFHIRNPHLEVHPIAWLRIDRTTIPFGTFDNQHRVAFDLSSINVAGQWDIVNPETGFLITRTMVSFISNKIWAWVDRGRQVWREEDHAD